MAELQHRAALLETSAGQMVAQGLYDEARAEGEEAKREAKQLQEQLDALEATTAALVGRAEYDTACSQRDTLRHELQLEQARAAEAAGRMAELQHRAALLETSAGQMVAQGLYDEARAKEKEAMCAEEPLHRCCQFGNSFAVEQLDALEATTAAFGRPLICRLERSIEDLHSGDVSTLGSMSGELPVFSVYESSRPGFSARQAMLEAIAQSLGASSSSTIPTANSKQVEPLPSELVDQAHRFAVMQRKYDDDCSLAHAKLEAAAGMIEELQELVMYHRGEAVVMAKLRRSQVSVVCTSAMRNQLLLKVLMRWSRLSTSHRDWRPNELRIQTESSRLRGNLQSEQMYQAELEELEKALEMLRQRNIQLESTMAETQASHHEVCRERDQLRVYLHSEQARLEMTEEENRLNRRNLALKAQAAEGMSHEVNLSSFAIHFCWL
jgi:hypothetical protein